MADSKGKSSHIHQHNPISTPPLPSSFSSGHQQHASSFSSGSFTSQADTIRSPRTASTFQTSFNSTFDSPPPSSTFSTASSFSSSPLSSHKQSSPSNPASSTSNQHHHYIHNRSRPASCQSIHHLTASPKSFGSHSMLSSRSRSSPQTPPIAANTPGSSIPLSPDSPSKKGNQSRFSKPSSQNNIQLDQSVRQALIPEIKPGRTLDTQRHHSIGTIHASDASTIDPSSQFRRLPRSLESIRSNNLNYPAPLPCLPSPQLPPSSSHPKVRKCPSSNSRNSTARSSRSKKKGRSIASEKTNESSFDSIPAILPRFSRSSEVNLPLDSRLSYLKQPDTLASIYMVCGLPKNSQCWSLAQPDYLPSHLPGAVPRFWRPEVLGTTISGEEIISSHIDGPGESSGRNNDFGSESISKEELSKIQSKAVKLAFAREVEVIASTVQPPSTTHCFSFTVPARTGDQHESSGALGHQWDLSLTCSSESTSRQPAEKTYYAACLLVWSHSDRSRAEAIRKTLEEGSKAKSAAVVQAIKAAAAGRKLGTRLEKAVGSPMGFLPSSTELSSNASRPQSSHHAHSIVESSDTEENECFFSDSDWETGTEVVSDKITSGLLNNPVGSDDTVHDSLSPNTPLWLPYCLVLISKFPLYDLLVDHLKISWARYHNSILKHSQEMLKMLNFTLPKSLSIIKLPVGSSKESNTNFVVKLPGKKDLSNGGLEEVNFTMWPLFKCLSLSHIISIYEIGLSPMGRIVFFSSHPPILNIAVESFKLLLELRGWTGLCQSIIHSRDFKIYLEDPGPFILGANSQLRHIASDISPEIMVVDLDTDTIRCPKPHPDALSKGPVRMKIEKKFSTLLGNLHGARSVPVELQEAFPGGRFRPFSAVEIKDQPSEAERLLPPPEWNWSQTRTIIIFDDVMSKIPRKGLGKILKRTTNRQAAVLDSSALHVQEIIRKHTIRFVDRRDMLENKIWKLNRRLAFLMSESMEWKQHFDNFQKFTDMLSTESQDLKTRLENERREHHTLTGVVAEQKSRQVELESRLLETEKAWMAAQVELAKAQEIREELQRQKEIMVSEMKSIALGGDDENMLGQIVPRIGSFIGPTPSRRSSMAPTRRISLTTQNLRRLSAQARLTSPSPSPSPSSTRLEPHEESECETDSPLYKLASTGGGYSNFLGGDSDIETTSDDANGLSETPNADERALLSRSAVVETMRSIQTRLEAALRTAGQLDEEELKGYDVHSPFAKSALSRMSTDSQGSKLIALQRGRRKPQNSVNFDFDINLNSLSSSPMSDDAHSRPIDSRAEDFLSPNRPSNRPPRSSTVSRADAFLSPNRTPHRPPRSSTVSLLLPGSSIFGDPLNLSPNGSQFSSPSVSHDLDIVEESDDGDEDEDDDDDDDDENHDSQSDDENSCDDDTFVSANDHSRSPERRRISSDSSFISDLTSQRYSAQSNATSRVSILCASPSPTARRPRLSSQKTSSSFETKTLRSSGLVAFPTSPTELDEDDLDFDSRVQKYIQRGDGGPPVAAREAHPISGRDDSPVGKDPRRVTSGLKPRAKVTTSSLGSPLHHRPQGTNQRGSSFSTSNLKGQQDLPHSPLAPARTLHRINKTSLATIRLSSPARHSPSSAHSNESQHLGAELVDFSLDNLRFKLGSIQSSRRLRSTPSPTMSSPSSIRDLKDLTN
ncbi:hypothetical protein Pst134EA_007795 [Puccinia striiformis f. sp. tritici]|uniref:hypothetical protein n=1 Tax=Puccinia striiformis f. sp. tritici TaxID=168172 RepID=UPI002007AC5F|nr:hypothetical protein Pst134EA_007795 [Puccinia striiformis f. sp. tritici]KAH9470546.1 hypothetical protein Pst134EA_007795 [Puccinia striiformis f. sp. tritici]